jgi:hypothetical protein
MNGDKCKICIWYENDDMNCEYCNNPILAFKEMLWYISQCPILRKRDKERIMREINI